MGLLALWGVFDYYGQRVSWFGGHLDNGPYDKCFGEKWQRTYGYWLPLEQSDKLGGKLVNQTLVRKLRGTVNACNFFDLGFHGPKLTWTNERKDPARIMETIDRAWDNLEWFQANSKMVVRHLAKSSSDHLLPLLIEDG